MASFGKLVENVVAGSNLKFRDSVFLFSLYFFVNQSILPPSFFHLRAHKKIVFFSQGHVPVSVKFRLPFFVQNLK